MPPAHDVTQRAIQPGTRARRDFCLKLTPNQAETASRAKARDVTGDPAGKTANRRQSLRAKIFFFTEIRNFIIETPIPADEGRLANRLRIAAWDAVDADSAARDWLAL